MPTSVRVTAHSLSGESPNLVLDLLLDERGEVYGDDVILGFQGSVNHPSLRCAPFVLYDDGLIDYGHEVQELRNAKLDLRAGLIHEGRRLNLSYGDKVQGFEIKRVRNRLI